MGFFDFFKRKDSAETKSSLPDAQQQEAVNWMTKLLQEAADRQNSFYYTSYLDSVPAVRDLLGREVSFRKAVLRVCMTLMKEFKAMVFTQSEDSRPFAYSARIGAALTELLMATDVELNDEEILELALCIQPQVNEGFFKWDFPKQEIFTRVNKAIKTHGFTAPLTQCLKLLENVNCYPNSAEERKLNEKIKFLLQGDIEIALDLYEPLGKEVFEFLEMQKGQPDGEKWKAVIQHATAAGNKSAPGGKWLKDASQLMEECGKTEVVKQWCRWLELATARAKEMHKEEQVQLFLTENNHNLLKGMIWMAGLLNDPAVNECVDAFGLAALRKKPNVGAISLRTGNACLYSFTLLPFRDAISQLSKFRNKIKYPNVHKTIDKYIADIGRREGISPARILEICIPDFGLNAAGELKKMLGTWEAVVKVDGPGRSALRFEKNGKSQASVPAEIKVDFAAEIKALKNTEKAILEQLRIQADRIENLWVAGAVWKYAEWEETYGNHPLVQLISRHLIWELGTGEDKKTGMFDERGWINSRGEAIDMPPPECDVRLWHPLVSTSDEVLEWRERITALQVRQPFKQAFREIYLVTPAELQTATYSNRFAAHILRQHQFAALCRQKRWEYTLQGGWDSHNTPAKWLPDQNIRIEFWVDPVHENGEGGMNAAGIYTHISTDQVRFYNQDQQMRMDEVPAMIFSELMREVDLFTGVCSIGNDPNWTDSGNQRLNNYWVNYSLAELTEQAHVREAVLKNLVPKLKIASRCSFDGRHLVVRGNLNTYSIHIGSGNIFMSPNHRYLCIVPSREAGKIETRIFLPFEGDHLLSIIISKALLLAEDDKITDPTIVRQLNRLI